MTETKESWRVPLSERISLLNNVKKEEAAFKFEGELSEFENLLKPKEKENVEKGLYDKCNDITKKSKTLKTFLDAINHEDSRNDKDKENYDPIKKEEFDVKVKDQAHWTVCKNFPNPNELEQKHLFDSVTDGIEYAR